MIRRTTMLTITALGFAAVTLADAPFATAAFERKLENSDKREPISSATLTDYVCFVVKDVSTPDGDHSYRLVIYDGAGNEVRQTVARVTAIDRRWSFVSCANYDEDRDQPGIWVYVAELDDQPLVSKELEVAAAK